LGPQTRGRDCAPWIGSSPPQGRVFGGRGKGGRGAVRPYVEVRWNFSDFTGVEREAPLSCSPFSCFFSFRVGKLAILFAYRILYQCCFWSTHSLLFSAYDGLGVLISADIKRTRLSSRLQVQSHSPTKTSSKVRFRD